MSKKNSPTEHKFLHHWEYFLRLESEFSETLRYVEFDKKHFRVFSFEFSRSIMLTCSELDTIFKAICKELDSNKTPSHLDEYHPIITNYYNIETEEIYIPRSGKNIQPFKEWKKGNAPRWWASYNKVKHQRHEKFELATLENSLLSIAGLFIANLIYLDCIKQLSEAKQVPKFLNRKQQPADLGLQSSYKVNKI